MITDDLLNTVLFEPIRNGADKLLIVSGYATPNMASWLIKSFQEKALGPVNISLLVGMVPYDGLSVAAHEGFKELHGKTFAGMSHFSCSYVYENPPVHSNLYLWMKQNNPYMAFCGSAEFMQSSFLSSRMEAFAACDPQEAYAYFREIEARSIYCNHGEVAENVLLRPNHRILDDDNYAALNISGRGIECVELSLLSKSGETGKRSGLNWGQRNSRNKNEAYIPLPSKIAKSGFFPLEKQHFLVETDDNCTLLLRVEQQNDKAITTPLSNAQLGEYFRRRLNLAYGAFITKQHLIDYGRTSVMFYKIDDEEFYMDFAPKG